ncbi:hypothetical protein PRIPAC_70004 [Pristionchus pacificus]|uniref:Uncharacterized protein n=1 Tax=Pristionchus pacificus TaxID=54126 RepID=A0A2A6C604_PRIPA|nr:hypothetical protein PRIPAC_70004 [Pristionchus pacificus]|eukprot:PDM73579.1 hypothetical protein PRIPAC_40935 [Pristionchus pacificus]
MKNEPLDDINEDFQMKEEVIDFSRDTQDNKNSEGCDDSLDNLSTMPNLVYYRDNSGVVRGPIHEEEATALFNANFFRPDHVFRIIDAGNSEEFSSIDDLRSLNGAETPFGKNGEEKEQKELVRVYKELEQSLKTRLILENKVKGLEKELEKFGALEYDFQMLKMKEKERDVLEKWEEIQEDGSKLFKITRTPNAGAYVARFENRSPIDVWVMYSYCWTPTKFRLAEAGGTVDLYGTGYKKGNGLYIAPYLSCFRKDNEPFVSYHDEFKEQNWHKFNYQMPNLIYYKDNSGIVSGPLKEEEATALCKANFFRPDHVFRIVDAHESEGFFGIGDLKESLQQAGEAGESKELVRVYKELASVMKERNELKAQLDESNKKLEAINRKKIIDQTKALVEKKQMFRVRRYISQNCVYGSWCKVVYTEVENLSDLDVYAAYGKNFILLCGRSNIRLSCCRDGGSFLSIAPNIPDYRNYIFEIPFLSKYDEELEVFVP